MYLLDLPTIMLMTTLMSGAMSIVMFAAHRSFGADAPGMGRWSLGLLLLVVAALLFVLRRWLPLPPQLALLGVNLLVLGCVGLSMIGTQEFYGQRPAWKLFAAVCAVGTAAVTWWLLASPSFSARVAVFSLAVLVFYCVQMTLVARHGARHFSTYFFGALLLIQIVAVTSRGVAALVVDEAGADLMRAGPLANIYVAIANFMSLMLTVAFLTMATRRLQQTLEQRSTQDPLTGVLNRRGFGHIYDHQRAQLRRNGQSMTLLSIDLDHFKLVNDSYGHATGDRVLVHVASSIGTVLRASDCVARFGGEEFVVLLPGTGLDRALQAAERIQKALCAARADVVDGTLPSCTVSIGVACQLSSSENLDAVLNRADKALYRAKERGRDRVEVADDAVLPFQAAHA